MRFIKNGLLALLSIAFAALAFVASLGMVTPGCIGWFYEVKRPEELF